jgi:uncharacterized protein YceK
MQWLRNRFAKIAVAAAMFSFVSVVGSADIAAARTHHGSGFDDEYVYAATRAVNDMDAHPAVKLTLFPATIVLDTAFLPFAVLAGFIG